MRIFYIRRGSEGGLYDELKAALNKENTLYFNRKRVIIYTIETEGSQ